MGIRGQLTLLVPGLVAVGLVSIAFLAAESQRRDDMAELRVRRQQQLQAVGLTAAVFIAQNDMAGLDTLVAHVWQQHEADELESLAVLDSQGRVLAHNRPEMFNSVLNDEFTRSAVAANETVWRWEPGHLFMAVPAESGVRWATVVATWSLTGLEAHVTRTRGQWLMVAVALFLILGAIQYIGLDRLIVQPVRSLQFAVRRMGEGALSVRAPAVYGRELSELSAMVNKMAETLQAERDNLERTVAARTKELQDVNMRLERLAVTDGLTGIFNHRRFQEALNAELLRSARTGRTLSVLMIDVDLFKRVNDALGHPTGDELLRRIATVLNSALRQTDLLARYGGEEFAVLLPETSKSEASAAAERMRAAIEAQVNDDKQWPQLITISIGVASHPEDGATAEDVLNAADQALYAAKRLGRNRVVSAKVAA